MTMFWLRCREGWKDTKGIELTPILDTTGVTQKDIDFLRRINAMSDQDVAIEIKRIEAQQEAG